VRLATILVTAIANGSLAKDWKLSMECEVSAMGMRSGPAGASRAGPRCTHSDERHQCSLIMLRFGV
jgi:hypothetical protein